MKNNRRDFIKLTGLAGAASIIPAVKISAEGNGNNHTKVNAGCVLVPTETAGPFPLDLTTNNTYFRNDVRESKTGVQLNLKLKIVGAGNCEPMQNVRVNIWHCDKDGLYSGYDQTNNKGQAGLTYLRGYQITDANGIVNFVTIFPGWYTGRICHIHFQVYVSSSYAAISQLTFDIPSKNAIYSANSSLYTKGTDPMTLQQDMIFSDGYTYQIATLTPNSETGGYDSYLEVTVQGNGTLGVGHEENQTAKQFTLGQNYPNPYTDETAIPITLEQPSDVTVDLWDLSEKKVATISKKEMKAGEQTITVNLKELGIANSSYVYQIEVVNHQGTFRQCMMMTSGK